MNTQVIIGIILCILSLPTILFFILQKSNKQKKQLMEDLDTIPYFNEDSYNEKTNKILKYFNEEYLKNVMLNSSRNKENLETVAKTLMSENDSLEKKYHQNLAIYNPLIVEYKDKYNVVNNLIKTAYELRYSLATALFLKLSDSRPDLIKEFNRIKAEEKRRIEEQKRREEEERLERERKARLKREAERKRREEEEEEDRRRRSYSSSYSSDSSSSSSDSSSSWGSGDGGGFSGGGASGDF